MNEPAELAHTIGHCLIMGGKHTVVEACQLKAEVQAKNPGAVIRPVPGEWHPRMPERLDEEELADWQAGRNAVYQPAALTIGARLAVADA